SSCQPPGVKCGILFPLRHIKDIVFQILFNHKPGLTAAETSPYAQAFSLTQGIIHQAVMPAHYQIGLLQAPDFSGPGRKIAAYKLPEIPLPDKADPGAVLAMGCFQTCFLCYAADRPLCQAA